MRQVVLVFLRRNHQVLLGRKKTGFGMGKFVAVGGHLEPYETAVQAAVRECFEETNLSIKKLSLVARVEFIFSAQSEWNMHAEVFESWDFLGQPLESLELAPEWFELGQLPFKQMWDDAGFWVPHVLDGARFNARIVYNSDHQTVQDVQLEPWG